MSNLDKGGIQSLMATLSFELAKRYELHILLFNGESQFDFAGTLHNLHIPPAKGFFGVAIASIRKLFALRTAVIKIAPDHLYAASRIPSMFVMAAFCIFGPKTKTVLSFHNSIVLKNRELGIKGRLAVALIRVLLSKRYIIHVVSEGIKNELIGLGFPAGRIVRIYNAVDIDKAVQLSKETCNEKVMKEKVVRIISVGRFEVQKNLPMLIDAFARVEKQKKECRLVLIGEGSLGDSLREQVRLLGLEKKVFFLGWQKNPFKFMRCSDIFVLSSLWEGFGNVIIEAMACACAVVTTNCNYGPAEIIRDGINGLVAESGNADDLAAKILLMCENKNNLRRRLTEQAKIDVENYSVKRIAAEYEAKLFDTDRDHLIG